MSPRQKEIIDNIMAVVGKYKHTGISKMPTFIDNIAIIFRSRSPYFTLSSLVHKSRRFKEIFKSDILESLADLESGKYEAYLPEIAVHKTVYKTSKAKPLAIFKVMDRPTEAAFLPFA